MLRRSPSLILVASLSVLLALAVTGCSGSAEVGDPLPADAEASLVPASPGGTPRPTVDPVPAESAPSPEDDTSSEAAPATTPTPHPGLAGLVEDCTGGSDTACDIVFQMSDLGSDAEDIAADCGGRGRDGAYCTAGIEPDGANVWFDDDSPGLGDVVAACQDGDMTACDFLYLRSAVASPFEEVGRTCGERVTVALPDCRTAFAN